MKNVQSVKNIGTIIVVVIVVISLFILTGILVHKVNYSEPRIMQTVSSPDGKCVAYIFESNSGATSGWVYHISILKSGKKLGKGSGNTYISNMPPNSIEWLSNDELYVDDYRNKNTTRKKLTVNGIKRHDRPKLS